MNQKTLSHEQVITIFLALIGREGPYKATNLFMTEALARPVRIESLSEDGQLGVIADIHLLLTYPGGETEEFNYQLYIGYYDEQQNVNPFFIGIGIFTANGPQGQPVANLEFVTERLKEYNIW
ncbi:hypothetical protein [Spirosoma foliorum]|uniref:Uncharacterized protein n=1 Tax=Spirosoma foliorum TaxID=2710596 RepID=A0A7G5GTT4_9BACT|nr:hypothetical protein [Spirosoma foliorum]QMW02276.1 hypothetical protein H3H32_30860 [Spirosoma foliorum]